MNRTYTITEVSNLLFKEELSEEMLIQLRQDKRKGIQQLIEKYDRVQQKQLELKEKYQRMLTYEQEQYVAGKQWIAGMDEAGRGPLAGPVVAACVVLKKDFYLPGLNDSKQLTEKAREKYYPIIIREAASYGVGIVESDEIDRINIFQATKKAMKQAFFSLAISPDYVLIDAIHLPDIPCNSQALTKGDQKSVSIAAASVIAKVTRDRIMREIHEKHPMYDFNTNMGYGTKKHLEAIERYGATSYHRKTFAPINRIKVQQGGD
ncbi:ribonuclease HII [Aquibacillus sp. 3ASR75-11]|uniref:Ribonuclease HII n=1 Tax=Terrihalobacillus insolitus TaxID=2950438 RepID=A0A9X4AML3_9BACI|nr:ribonuclease HII [Terrihalobacillus insolitus]MDC3414153.1 ribonuclease HII [Terrihalobacillus insolitus]MDC3423595.1 ribonuclease HII [Terrihalobacillus insolitus]